jgi:hypothetical protein
VGGAPEGPARTALRYASLRALSALDCMARTLRGGSVPLSAEREAALLASHKRLVALSAALKAACIGDVNRTCPVDVQRWVDAASMRAEEFFKEMYGDALAGIGLTNYTGMTTQPALERQVPTSPLAIPRPGSSYKHERIGVDGNIKSDGSNARDLNDAFMLDMGTVGPTYLEVAAVPAQRHEDGNYVFVKHVSTTTGTERMITTALEDTTMGEKFAIDATQHNHRHHNFSLASPLVRQPQNRGGGAGSTPMLDADVEAYRSYCKLQALPADALQSVRDHLAAAALAACPLGKLYLAFGVRRQVGDTSPNWLACVVYSMPCVSATLPAKVYEGADVDRGGVGRTYLSDANLPSALMEMKLVGR